MSLRNQPVNVMRTHRCDRCELAVHTLKSERLKRGWARTYTLWRNPSPHPKAWEDCEESERLLCPACWLILAAFLNSRGSAASGEL